MADPFAYPNLHRDRDLGRPARAAAAITPHDTNEVANIPQAIRCGTGGTVVALLMDDTSTVTFTNVANGETLPIRVRKVMATGTTASGIIALF